MWRLFTPDLLVGSVLELDAARVRRLGLESLLLDVDSTLKSYRSERVAPEVSQWLERLRAEGIGLCLISNGRASRIRRLARAIGLPVVCLAAKPLPFGCRRALRQMGFDPRRTAMVGDQIFADVMAGRLANLYCILVRPIAPEQEHWYTRIKRPLERIVLRRMQAQATSDQTG